MLNFKTRSQQPEILDDFELKGHDLSENLRELEKVNQRLGGYTTVKNGLRQIRSRGRLPAEAVRVVDVGCGGGDTLRELWWWGRKNRLPLYLTGVDANPAAVKYASARAGQFPQIQFRQMNILSEEFEDLEADIVMFNLFLHHFSEEEILQFLKVCKSKGCTVLINDLHRSKLAYHAFRLTSRIFRFSYISRHDGKLSVKKSFVRSDWERMMKKAGFTDYSIKWQWAFRYLVVAY